MGSSCWREWREDEIKFLTTVANVIQNALRREHAQLALRESQELYKNLTEKSLTGIYIIQDGVFVYTNNMMNEIFGYGEGELLGKDAVSTLVHPEDRLFVTENVKARLEGKVPSVHYVFRGMKKNGEEIWLECIGSGFLLKGNSALVGNVIDITERVKNEIKRNRLFEAVTMLAVSMVEYRDPYTAGHQRRVADIAVAIGEYMGMEKCKLEGLRLAALLHDIGKISVPIEILTKPGKLRPSDFEIVKLHCQAGADILAEVPFPWDISSVVLQHHERLDGSGYPYGIRGEEICLEARILAVADVVEAMSSHRPYRPSLGLEAALEEIKQNAGKLYDPYVVEAMVAVCSKIEWH